MFSVKQKLLLAGIFLIPALSALADSNALWHIVHEQCVPHLKLVGDPAPCAKVDISQGEDSGYSVKKDLRGVLQYLLIPTGRVSGIESPALLANSAPDYWGEAWASRNFMSRLRGSEVPREAVALTINSIKGRSQSQLHIHISCVRGEVRDQLTSEQAQIGLDWIPLPGGLNGHPYQVRRVLGRELTGVEPFKDIAAALPGARDDMGDMTLAVVGARFAGGQDGFYLLAGKADPTAGIEGSAEDDVQDHSCQVLN
ncbi:CDP-diacylglycerol diphosphatase [Neisseriaceae bacterium JH1-16]|nr:CDP-diacylglycerol diphosphatase [Neisseriaceae bacterium JH1-16]